MHVCVIGLAQPQTFDPSNIMHQNHDRIGLKYLTVLTKLVITFYLEGWTLGLLIVHQFCPWTDEQSSYTGVSLSSTAYCYTCICCRSFGIFLCNRSTDIKLLCRISLNTLQTWFKTVIHISWLPTPEIMPGMYSELSSLPSWRIGMRRDWQVLSQGMGVLSFDLCQMIVLLTPQNG